MSAMTTVQQSQERWRSNRDSYADGSLLPGFAGTTANGRYTVAISGESNTGYTVTATAAGSQAADTTCAVLAVRILNGNLSYGSGSSSVNWADPDPDPETIQR